VKLTKLKKDTKCVKSVKAIIIIELRMVILNFVISVMAGIKHTRNDVQDVLQILADKLDRKEYAKVTSLMSMLFVGHTFELSDDGFEFINLVIKTKKNQAKKLVKINRQSNVIKLKPRGN
jgi:hypothetical protein